MTYSRYFHRACACCELHSWHWQWWQRRAAGMPPHTHTHTQRDCYQTCWAEELDRGAYKRGRQAVSSGPWSRFFKKKRENLVAKISAVFALVAIYLSVNYMQAVLQYGRRHSVHTSRLDSVLRTKTGHRWHKLPLGAFQSELQNDVI